MFDEDITLVLVPGWGNSGPQHWQSHWEKGYPLAAWVEQRDWLYPSRDTWVAALADTIATVDGRVVVAAHSLGCHTAVEWLLSAPLAEQCRVQGMLLVAPPALPIRAEQARASGELPDDAPLPDFAGFEAPRLQRLPVPTLMVASQDDPFCDFAESRRMAEGWDVPLIDAGRAGHMGSDSGLDSWPAGQKLLQRLMLG
ncbi:alpha/beta hydrolase [Crenobacter sp. SG2303]|uniref:Alpha/beta hydrolase n=1 Tax=Crenobacter oryzisoli TaxID=3056844 RepID=A0ABT7XPK9_9NEIS|nr:MULTISPECIES: alpha/beta hydrolase [unclassified Crenobacter]MDN0075734.1 alpha/beta hydrolase [Crenobacter sp. SG2303]MDN0083050.1 alpha/beta hydrolase [Crenobacter sp. SG2305]